MRREARLCSVVGFQEVYKILHFCLDVAFLWQTTLSRCILLGEINRIVNFEVAREALLKHLMYVVTRVGAAVTRVSIHPTSHGKRDWQHGSKSVIMVPVHTSTYIRRRCSSRPAPPVTPVAIFTLAP